MSYPSYRFSYPLYLDVSDAHKQNPLDSNLKLSVYERQLNSGSSSALINLNAFYETMLANGQPAGQTNVSRAGQMHGLGFGSGQCRPQMQISRRLSEEYCPKSSFSIEAILGIANQQNNYLSPNESKRCDLDTNYRPDFGRCPQLSSKFSQLPKAKSIASVSPDSTAKGKHRGNRVKAAVASCC